MLKAAAPFVRIRIRVPEAYLILRPFRTTRPGLLVLDADGRRVTSIPLSSKAGPPDAADVAAAITAAGKSAAEERILLQGPAGALGPLAKALGALSGVSSVQQPDETHLELWAEPGRLSPDRIAAAATAAEIEVEFIDPVPLRIEALKPGMDIRAALRKLPGTWYTSAKEPRAWVSRWLLHPDRLKAVGLKADIVARRFAFVSLPKGGGAVPHLLRPFPEPGVLAVVPDVFHDAIEVIGRTGRFDAARMEKVFEAAGLTRKSD